MSQSFDLRIILPRPSHEAFPLGPSPLNSQTFIYLPRALHILSSPSESRSNELRDKKSVIVRDKEVTNDWDNSQCSEHL